MADELQLTTGLKWWKETFAFSSVPALYMSVSSSSQMYQPLSGYAARLYEKHSLVAMHLNGQWYLSLMRKDAITDVERCFWRTAIKFPYINSRFPDRSKPPGWEDRPYWVMVETRINAKMKTKLRNAIAGKMNGWFEKPRNLLKFPLQPWSSWLYQLIRRYFFRLL